MVNYLHKIFSLKTFSTSQKIACSFLLVIFVGTLLLMLPISHHNQQVYPFIDAFFTATSATCVTGLVVDVTLETFSVFGQIVVMLLIQIGGLGLMTLMSLFILLMKSKLSMNEKYTLKEMLNHDKVFDINSYIVDIIKYTLLFEGIGVALLSIRFLPLYGVSQGLFKSLFISISAFCNAGFDVIGSTSLIPFQKDPLIMLTIMFLIIVGGVGFAVWFDFRDKYRALGFSKFRLQKFYKSLSLHTKLVLHMTILLIFGGAFVFFLLENFHGKSIQHLNTGQQIIVSMFESTTLRTAGFASVDYASLSMATKFFMILVMFIGGSPGGTAGGIKTTTVAVLFLFILSNLKGKNHTTVFNRTISKDIIVRAMGIFFVNLITLFLGVFILCMSEDASFLDILFESTSALATVGLTLGITSTLTFTGKIVIILLMFIGRIGITTFVLSLLTSAKNKKDQELTYPNGNVIIG